MQVKELRGSFFADVPAAGQPTAGTPDEFAGFVAPFDMKVVGAVWVPEAAITANGTNFFTLTVRNRKADASGTALPAQRSYAATNSVAFAPEDMTLSSTAADLVLAEGDHLTVEKLVSGTGLAMPAGVVRLYLQGN